MKMEWPGEENPAGYRHLGRIAEFCHAWIKTKVGLREFYVGGYWARTDNAVGLPHITRSGDYGRGVA